MILSLRQIRRRIKSVENTKKITHAMEMVAAAKLKKLQDLLKQSDHYIAELKRILATLVREKSLAHPLLEKRDEIKSTLVFLIASETGLCGSYNTNVLEQANRFLKTEGTAQSVRFVAIGKYAANHLKRSKSTIVKAFSIPKPQEIDNLIQEVTEMATSAFTNREADRVVFIYTKVATLSSLKPTQEQLFPLTSTEADSQEKKQVDYIIEPDLNSILDFMLPEFIAAEIAQFVKHSMVAEQASRMMAMRQATDSAKDMIDSLTLLRNKARQANITKELLEIVSGSRALQMK